MILDLIEPHPPPQKKQRKEDVTFESQDSLMPLTSLCTGKRGRGAAYHHRVLTI